MSIPNAQAYFRGTQFGNFVPQLGRTGAQCSSAKWIDGQGAAERLIFQLKEIGAPGLFARATGRRARDLAARIFVVSEGDRAAWAGHHACPLAAG